MASAKNPSDTSGRLIAAEKVTGTPVFSQAGEKLGKIEDIMLDKLTGHTCYAVLSAGGFFGIGDKRYPLPWEKLSYDPIFGGFVVDVDKAGLAGAPRSLPNEPVG